MKKGKILVAGTAIAKVKKLLNENGQDMKEAGPGTAAEIMGWKELAHPGEQILEAKSEAHAREIVKSRQNKLEEQKRQEDQVVIDEKAKIHSAEQERRREKRLEMGFRAFQRSEKRPSEVVSTTFGPELNILIRGDVDGSVEAILNTISTYNSQQCHLHILKYEVGIVSEQDVELTATFNGIIYAFNTKVPSKVAALANDKNVPVKEHNIIYKLIDDLRDELTERLEPVDEEVVIGEANVLQLFKINVGKKTVPVAGCRCTSGVLNRKKKFKLVRNEETILSGSVLSLKHLKNEVDTIKNGIECGIRLDSSVEPQPGDTIVCYEVVKKPQQLQWDLNY